jgi:hypothetical protein
MPQDREEVLDRHALPSAHYRLVGREHLEVVKEPDYEVRRYYRVLFAHPYELILLFL